MVKFYTKVIAGIIFASTLHGMEHSTKKPKKTVKELEQKIETQYKIDNKKSTFPLQVVWGIYEAGAYYSFPDHYYNCPSALPTVYNSQTPVTTDAPVSLSTVQIGNVPLYSQSIRQKAASKIRTNFLYLLCFLLLNPIHIQ